MFTTRRFLALLSALTIASSAVSIACDDDTNAVKEPPVGADSGPTPGTDSGPGTDGGGDSGTDGGPTDCFVNPKTHAEIINACTTAVKITKNPVLPKLLPDGGLPPL